jgi:hypothetical protein
MRGLAAVLCSRGSGLMWGCNTSRTGVGAEREALHLAESGSNAALSNLVWGAAEGGPPNQGAYIKLPLGVLRRPKDGSSIEGDTSETLDGLGEGLCTAVTGNCCLTSRECWSRVQPDSLMRSLKTAFTSPNVPAGKPSWGGLSSS